MTVRRVVLVLAVVLAASAWLTYAQQPNRRNLGHAVRDTLPLL